MLAHKSNVHLACTGHDLRELGPHWDFIFCTFHISLICKNPSYLWKLFYCHASLVINPSTNFQNSSGRSHEIPPWQGLNLRSFIMTFSLTILWQQFVCLTVTLIFYRNHNLHREKENKIEFFNYHFTSRTCPNTSYTSCSALLWPNLRTK